jgi:hypothetical protein
VAAEVDGEDLDDAVGVAAGSLGSRWVELVVDPPGAGDLVVDGLGVARPLGPSVLALHHARGADLGRLAGCHRHVIPEQLTGIALDNPEGLPDCLEYAARLGLGARTAQTVEGGPLLGPADGPRELDPVDPVCPVLSTAIVDWDRAGICTAAGVIRGSGPVVWRS